MSLSIPGGGAGRPGPEALGPGRPRRIVRAYRSASEIRRHPRTVAVRELGSRLMLFRQCILVYSETALERHRLCRLVLSKLDPKLKEKSHQPKHTFTAVWHSSFMLAHLFYITSITAGKNRYTFFRILWVCLVLRRNLSTP